MVIHKTICLALSLSYVPLWRIRYGERSMKKIFSRSIETTEFSWVSTKLSKNCAINQAMRHVREQISRRQMEHREIEVPEASCDQETTDLPWSINCRFLCNFIFLLIQFKKKWNLHSCSWIPRHLLISYRTLIQIAGRVINRSEFYICTKKKKKRF